MEQFGFYAPTRIEFGTGVSGRIANEVSALGASRVLVITDKGILASGMVEPLLRQMEQSHITITLFDAVKSNPRDIDCHKAAALGLEAKVDLVLAIGGGSPIDTAKAVAALITNGGEVKDWVGEQKLHHPTLPLICIPTTAGTGSEVTMFAVITDAEQNLKTCIADTRIAPALALVDPGLTMSLPPLLTASTGIDALTHAIEAYTCNLHNPVSDALALKAISLICQNIRQAVEQGENLEARSNMMLGSLLAGIAFGNADVAGVHCMAEAIGGLYDIPHGIANSILLPFVMEYNIPAALERHAEIGRAMGVAPASMPDHEAAAAAVEAVKKLSLDLEIPRFKDLPNVNPDDFNLLAARAAANISAPSNCRPAGEKEYYELFFKAYRG